MPRRRACSDQPNRPIGIHETLTLDLADVVLDAGPKRPKAASRWPAVAESFAAAMTSEYKKGRRCGRSAIPSRS